MAAAHCATATTTTTNIFIHFPPPRKRSLTVYAFSTKFPSKPTKRKNYLRLKILKTLTKPYPIPQELPITNPLIPIESPLEKKQEHEQLNLSDDESDDRLKQLPELNSDQFTGENVVASEEIISSPQLVKPIAGNFFSYISFVQIGLGLVVIDIIRSIWLAYKYTVTKKEQNLGITDGNNEAKSEVLLVESSDGNNEPKAEVLLEENNDGKGKLSTKVLVVESNDGFNEPKAEVLLEGSNNGRNGKLSTTVLVVENNDGISDPNSEVVLKENGNLAGIKYEGDVIYEPEMDKKIAEIRDLAREAREKEKLKSEGKGVEEYVDDVDEDVVPRRLERGSKKQPLTPEGLAAEKAIKILMFKKKHRLNRQGINSEDTIPKGLGKQNHDVTVAKTNGALSDNVFTLPLEKDKEKKLPAKEALRNGSSSTMPLEEHKEKKLSAKETPRNDSSSTMPLEEHKEKKLSAKETLRNDSSSTMPLEEHKEKKLSTKETPRNDNSSTMPLEEHKEKKLSARETLRNDSSSTMPLEEDKENKLLVKETAHNNSSSRKKIIKERTQAKRRVTKSEQLNQSRDDVLGSTVSFEVDKGTKLPAENSTYIQGSRKKSVTERRGRKPRVTASEQGNLQGKSLSNSEKHDDLNGNGSLKVKDVGSGKSNNRPRGRKSFSNTDFWWLSLPHVLAIVLRNYSGGSQGLYTLRTTSQNMVDTVYRVTFEDLTDATNFCQILESYFKELSGFSAGITSISTKELEKALDLNAMKVLVVKKGQLELDAAQRLVDVEKAMESLVG